MIFYSNRHELDGPQSGGRLRDTVFRIYCLVGMVVEYETLGEAV